MKVISFADESGTSSGIPCYTIGVLNVPDEFLGTFNNCIKDFARKSGVRGELKWEKVRSSAGQINLCLDTIKFVLDSPCTFHAIAVQKEPYRKWRENEEDAFYTTYNFLLRQSSKGLNANCEIYIDQRCAVYKKQDELMQIITNHMLARISTTSKIDHVTMENSKLLWGLQAVDILTGAINAAYHLYFDPDAKMKTAKKIAIELMAKTIGWDTLAYDTYPNDSFNIWHFPPETRGKPKTENITKNLSVEGISRDEYEKFTL